MSTRRRNIRTQTEQELAELEAAEQAAVVQVHQADVSPTRGATQTETSPADLVAQTTAPQVRPRSPQEEQPEHGEEWADSRAHLVKHRHPRAEDEEEQFERVYKRETYYIDRSALPKLKKLIKKLDRTKTAVMNEALADLFTKYGIE